MDQHQDDIGQKHVEYLETKAKKPSMLDQMMESLRRLDGTIILNMLKNPMDSMYLNAGNDFVYGMIGIAASIIGFLLWISVVMNKVAFGLFGIISGKGLINHTFGHMFMLTLLSNVALVGSLWLVGRWLGSEKKSFKAIITRAGATQFIIAAGLIAAGIIALVTVKLSAVLAVIALISSFVMAIVLTMELCQVALEKRAYFMISVIAMYVILFVSFTAIIL